MILIDLQLHGCGADMFDSVHVGELMFLFATQMYP